MNNLIKRTLSGLVFLVIFIGAIVFDAFAYGLLMLFIITIGLFEYYKLMLPKEFQIRKYLGIFSGISLFLFTFYYSWSGIKQGILPYAVLMIPIVFIFIAELYSKTEQPIKMIAITVLGIFYIALPFSLMNFLVFPNPDLLNKGGFYYDYRMLLAFYIVLWTNDVGAYCVGSLLGKNGKHKLFERISPKKSWEGFIGGLLLSMVISVVLYYIWGRYYNVAPIHWAIIGLIISLFGTYGDLVESMLKRSVGVKDSGSIMPGHGGILDRFDGVLLSFPLMLVYWQLVN